MLKPDFPSLELGHQGAQRAAEHADRVVPLWTQVAWCRLLQFMIEKGTGSTFSTEAFRDWAAVHSLPDAPDRRAYGNLTKKAVEKGLIRFERYVRSANRQAHGRPTAIWRIL